MGEAERQLIVQVNQLQQRLVEARNESVSARGEHERAEARGRRWLNDALAMDDEIERLIVHCEREAEKGNDPHVHQYLMKRLRRIREATT